MPAIPASAQPWLLPNPNLSVVPGDLILDDGQLQWGNVVFGADPFFTQQIDGWEELPGIDSGNVARPSAHGSWPGRFLLQERTVTWTGWCVPIDTKKSLQSAIRWSREATTVPDEPTEVPLVIRSLGETLMAWGKLSKRAVSMDQTYGSGGAQIALQFICSDPRRYELDQQVAQLSLIAPAPGGLTYPLTYPLTWGPEATFASSAVLTNGMDAPTPPTITISGPCDVPLVVNQTTGTQLEFAVSMGETDALVIDCRAGTVMLNGIDRLWTRTARGGPVAGFQLAGGDNLLAFKAVEYAPGNGAVITWRSATF